MISDLLGKLKVDDSNLQRSLLNKKGPYTDSKQQFHETLICQLMKALVQ
jgi:hypothetical protein